MKTERTPSPPTGTFCLLDDRNEYSSFGSEMTLRSVVRIEPQEDGPLGHFPVLVSTSTTFVHSNKTQEVGVEDRTKPGKQKKEGCPGIETGWFIILDVCRV